MDSSKTKRKPKLKRSAKQLLAAVLALVLMLTVMPISALAATVTTGSGLKKNDVVFTDGDTDYAITSLKQYNVAPNIKEYTMTVNDTDSYNTQTVANIMEVSEAANSNTETKAVVGYGDIDADGDEVISDTFATTTKQAELWESTYPEENVVGGVNAAWFNTSTAHPSGTSVINGVKIQETSTWPYFATYSDGSCTIEQAGTSIADAEAAQSEKVGSTVTMTGAVAGPALLVDNYEIGSTVQGNNGLYSRSAVGIKDDGTVVIFQADGTMAPRSCGFDQTQEAEMLVQIGCQYAIQLDEGGSSTFISQREGESSLTMRNTPAGGSERGVSSTVLIVSTASEDGVFDHADITPNEVYYTPNSTVELSATGIDYSGAEADFGSDVEWVLDAESSATGTVTAGSVDGSTATATFVSNGTTGEAVIDIIVGGEVAGSTSIYFVHPQTIEFSSTEISVSREEVTDLGIKGVYEHEDVILKDGDVDFVIEYEDTYGDENSEGLSHEDYIAKYPIGSFEGLNLHVTDDVTVSCTAIITGTYTEADIPSATTNVTVGKEPLIVMDGGDDDGRTYMEGQMYSSSTISTIGDAIGVMGYNNGAVDDLTIINVDDEDYGDLVRFGEKAVKLDFDLTVPSANLKTDGCCIGTGDYLYTTGSPDKVGIWVYIPNENQPVPWLRIQFQASTGVDANGDPTWGGNSYLNFVNAYGYPCDKDGNETGQELQVGWNYLEADFSDYAGSNTQIRILPGCCLRCMVDTGVNSGKYNLKHERLDAADVKGWILVDNFMFVYGSSMQDEISPNVDSFQFYNDDGTKTEIENGAVVNSNTVSFYATYDDNEDTDPYAKGVDAVYFYIDGNSMGEGDKDNLGSTLSGVTLANGKHTVMLYVKDGYGNVTRDTRTFYIDGEEDYPSISLDIPDSPEVNQEWTLDLNASDVAAINSVSATVSVSTDYPVTNVNFPDGVEGTWVYKDTTGVLTIEITSIDSSAFNEGERTLAEIVVSIPENITEGASVIVEVTKGSYTTDYEELTGTFSEESTSYKIASDYYISTNTLIVGTEGIITVADAEGNPVYGATVYLGGDNIGTTDENGELPTDALTQAPGTYSLRAEDAEGNSSYVVSVVSYSPVEEEGPYYISLNASADVTTEQNISWMSSTTYSNDEAYVKYSTNEDLSDAETVSGSSNVITYLDDNQVNRANNVQISGLTPDTTYYYVVGDGETWSGSQTFTTDAADPESVSFFVMADIQDSGAITGFKNIAQAMEDNGQSYTLGIQLGDAVDPPSKYSTWEDTMDLFTMDEFADTDWLHVIGNHELDDGGNNGIAAKTMFGTTEDWYSVEYGEVYIAVLNYVTSSTSLSAFGEWLIEDSAQTDCLYKIMVSHVPIYYTDPSGQGPTYLSALRDYVDDAGMDFCLAGNDHAYARTAPMTQGEVTDEIVVDETGNDGVGIVGTGTVYYVCGSTGGKAYTPVDNPDFNFRKCLDSTTDFNSIYLDVTADKDVMTITTYDVDSNGNSKVIDKYSKEVQYCENDEHSYIYDRETGKVTCADCPYKDTLDNIHITTWMTDAGTGYKMYYVPGTSYDNVTEDGFITGFIYMPDETTGESVTYWFDENGLSYNGAYTICGETCYFEDGAFVSSDNADVIDAGWAGDDVEYIIYSDGTMYIEGTGDMWDFESRTAVPWNDSQEAITSVTIGKDITRVGDYAFRGCTNLASVAFEEGSLLESIGFQAFDQCRFTEITLPATVKSIDAQAFAVNSRLRTIYIPDGSALESIASDILYKSTYTTISIEIDPEGTSAAKQFAIENDIPYVERIDNCTLVLSEDSIVYTGSAITPAVTIMYNGEAVALAEGSDYTLTYTNNVNVGTATVTVTGINGYTGTLTATYAITLAGQTLVVNPSANNVSVGETIDINAVGIGTITYKSSDTSVATVDSKGVVTAVNPGTAVITVTASGDANHVAATETVSITVNHLGCVYVIEDVEYQVTSDTSLVKQVIVIGGTDKQATKVEIPASVKIDNTLFIIVGIGDSAYEDYTKLQTVSIGDNVVSIGASAFAGCTKLTTVDGCLGLKTIGEKAFYKCSKLTTVNNCASVTKIGKKAFAYDTALTQVGTDAGVTTLSSLKSLGSYAFYNCAKLTAVKIPSGVTSIGTKTFTRCTALTKVTGCANITKIGNAAFYKCTSLKSIAGCSKVTSIGSKTFSYDISLTKIGTDTGMTTLNKLASIGSYAFYNCKSITAVKLPSTVTSIPAKVFVRCTALTKVTGCSGLKSIGSCAFYKCTSLVNVNNSSKVTSVGSKAFAYCTSLKRVGSTTSTMSLTSLKSLGSYAFYHCTSLTAVKIPSSMTSISEKTFVGCTKLAKVTGCSKLTKIGSYAFYGCSKLASVSGCTKVTAVGQKAFAYCSSLKRIGSTTGMVSLPKVQTLGAYAFYHCTSLKTVKITSTALNSIGKKCFAGDSKLSVIRLDTTKLTKDNVKSNAFKGIKSTATVKVPSAKVKAYKTILQAKGASKNIKVKGI